MSKFRAAITSSLKGRQVDPERNDHELLRLSDTKGLVDLTSLLLGNDHDLISCSARKDPFDPNEDLGLQLAVVAMKNVPVKRVNYLQLPRFPSKCTERQKSVHQPGNSAHGSRFSGMCMQNIWLNSLYFPIDLDQ